VRKRCVGGWGANGGLACKPIRGTRKIKIPLLLLHRRYSPDSKSSICFFPTKQSESHCAQFEVQHGDTTVDTGDWRARHVSINLPELRENAAPFADHSGN
jgi:hypothetical protein